MARWGVDAGQSKLSVLRVMNQIIRKRLRMERVQGNKVASSACLWVSQCGTLHSTTGHDHCVGEKRPWPLVRHWRVPTTARPEDPFPYRGNQRSGCGLLEPPNHRPTAVGVVLALCWRCRGTCKTGRKKYMHKMQHTVMGEPVTHRKATSAAR
jgi:hypothetical protein